MFCIRLFIKFGQHSFVKFDIHCENNQIAMEDKTRRQQKVYISEIREKYANSQQQFENSRIAWNSDQLNITVKDEKLISNTCFQKGDLMLQLRGGIISKQVFDQLKDSKKLDQDSLLQYLGFWDDEKTLLINVKNRTGKLFVHNSKTHLSSLKKNQGRSNCQLFRHLNSKIFVVASSDIETGEQIIMSHKSLHGFILDPKDSEK